MKILKLILALAVLAPALPAQKLCSCDHDGFWAAAFGGGVFVGLLAFALPHHHSKSDSTVAAVPIAMPVDSLAPDSMPALGMPPLIRRGQQHIPIHKAALPLVTVSEAASEGLLAPKTATYLPALGMLGFGLVLTGVLFYRVR